MAHAPARGTWPSAGVGHQYRVRASVTDRYRMLLKLVEDWKELCLAQTDPLETENLNDAVNRKTSLQSLSELMLRRTITDWLMATMNPKGPMLRDVQMTAICVSD